MQNKQWLKPLKLIPDPVHRLALQTALNKGLGKQFAAEDFDFLEGQVICIQLLDIPHRFCLSQANGKFVAVKGFAEPAVTISAKVEDFILLAARKADPDTLFFQRRLVIEGDTELGLQVKNLLDCIDPEKIPKPINLGLQVCASVVEKSLLK